MLRHLKIIQKMISLLTVSHFGRTFFRRMICAFRCRNRTMEFAFRLKMVKQSQRKELKWYKKKNHTQKQINPLTGSFISLSYYILSFFSLSLVQSVDEVDGYLFADFNGAKGTSLSLTIKAERYHSLAAIGSGCHKNSSKEQIRGNRRTDRSEW